MSKVELKREKKKNEIIQVAVELFTYKGFEKVAMSDLAEKMGMGRTTIYEYFRNKNEILVAYLEREMNIFYRKIMVAISDQGTLKSKLRRVLLVGLEYANHHQGFQQLFHNLTKNNSADAQKTNAILRKQHQKIYVALADEINKAIQAKEINDISVDIFVQFFFNITFLPVKSKKNLTETTEEILTYFWSGISS